ncbi:ABC transporter ATP-binding protein [Palleronia caenipelagi]|uniref:sn-glycerol-3-phosphate ABC transporter ATP-binding protein UgpC n=1 Tax=Palleronia caenipelagi TaxID=2489174 RepID=A0A547PLP0_9RHOB|nr:sn-glycerol-3-phosphate ABC transporter ATP-binding protein UgpC [Palleronia caenipelagi]TRD15036.1 sn-glycerol-3-phosphate ABC transporter ATP-binding protein UgpC [Palleronia caenipelagi]
MGTISIRNVDKFYGAAQALFGIDLEIADGEFLVLVGPSGCGKSTLLRTIAGLETMSGGDIIVDGKSVKGVPPKDRNLAMVFQNYALYPHMTVRENIGFSLRLKKTDAQTMAKRIADVADILGLEPLLDRYPKALSGGQRQRVGMGRALVRDPRAFLFDEPLSNLDAKLRVQMRTEIKELHERLKTTSVYVTHDQIEAMTMADRIVILEGGHIRQIGRPMELYDRPDNLFVAGFIGSPSMNFIDATVRQSGDRVVAVSDEGVELPIGGLRGAEIGQKVVCGMRPEQIQLGGDLDATLHLVEPTGPDTVLVCDLAGHQLDVVTRDRVDLRRGAPLKLHCPPEHIHLFDKATGDRLGDLMGRTLSGENA